MKVYLDNNATTRVDDQVMESMLPFFAEEYGNASSIHTWGQTARAAVEEARQQVAGLLGVRSREVVFTAGGTEADNMAVRGLALQQADRGRHVITSRIEHPAVLQSCTWLEKNGFEVTRLAASRDGVVPVDAFRAAIREDTVVASIMYANNEVGTIQPIREMSALARESGLKFHTDAVQAVGKIPLDVTSLGVEALSLAAHKFHGPKGIGALIVRDGVTMHPLMVGGSHERHRRAGTENVPGIVGLGVACRRAAAGEVGMDTRVREMRDRLEQGILSTVPETVVNGGEAERLPHVTNISFAGVEGEALLIALDFEGIAVSTGAACSSGSLEPSHVLTGMNLPRARIQGAIRFSLSRMTSDQEIDHTLDVLPALVERIRQTSGVR